MRIAFVGDSIVNGTGDPDCLGWTGRVCAAAMHEGHDVTHYNLGIRRDTSTDVLARWRQEVARRLPTGMDGRVVFSFGLNDLIIEAGEPRIPEQQSVANLQQLLTEARDVYPVLMVGPPPMMAEEGQRIPVERLSRRYAEVCDRLRLPYLDVVAPLEATGTFTREAMENDGAHPRNGGYAELAALVERWEAWRSWFKEDGSHLIRPSP